MPSNSISDLLGLGIDVDPIDVDGPYADMKRAEGDDVGIENWFQNNVDVGGKPLPTSVSYSDVAKRISPFGECFFFDYGVAVIWV
jgi:hypothetical protein